MTDKVQKIREEVERRKKLVDDPVLSDNDLIIGERNAYIRLLSFIDSMQEEHEFQKAGGDGMRKVINAINTNLSKEPVSEDLEEAAISYAATGEFLDNGKEMIDFQKEMSFKAGANWQKEQDQETIELAEDHAMLAGMEKMKEQMMKDAVEREVFISFGGNTVVGADGFSEGDKVKLIIIKEDLL